MKVGSHPLTNRRKLLVATRVYGAQGQPWMRRQVEGVRSWNRHLICWKYQSQPGQEREQIGLDALDYPLAPYDGKGRWWHRLKSLPEYNLYASQGAERRELEMILGRERPSVLLCY